MTKATVFFTKDSVKALVNFFLLIGLPYLSTVGTKLVTNQNQILTYIAEHDTAINKNNKDIISLKRGDQLLNIKVASIYEASKSNSETGAEWWVDYDKQYNDRMIESRFLNP